MRILANENIARATVDALRGAGHDVVWGRDAMPGASDEDMLRRATADERILLTADKDFGELAFRLGLPAASGVILVRIPGATPAEVAERTAAVLATRDEWAGYFAVAEMGRVRITRLPSQN